MSSPPDFLSDPTPADAFGLPAERCLDGEWDCGFARNYTRQVVVPGLVGDPGRIDTAPVWYRRRVALPEGEWSGATLILNGARFAPRVYVDGEYVSGANGGMAPTQHCLDSPRIKPGAQIVLEIELQPLDQLPVDDASVIPEADRWRSNVSSCLWDKVMLRFHRTVRLARLLPEYDASDQSLVVRYELEGQGAAEPTAALRLRLEDHYTEAVGSGFFEVSSNGVVTLPFDEGVTLWSPEQPFLYQLRAELWLPEGLSDRREMTVGLREFTTQGTGFRLNGNPVVLRSASVVWHRWTRDPESRELAFDPAWFERNVIERLKAYGVNTLRFHLGMPPEALLDLCDRHGLLVQAEWLFFHGLKASKSSMIEQWRAWLDLGARHPSTAIIHAWNETSPEELTLAWSALDQLLPEYPPLVVGHRDVIHLHKYWWSLFENLGLYYDSADQFSLPIMADEFGGNYLDGQGMPGGYPTLKESFLRFLGPDSTPAERLEFQAMANGKVAEYWRRLGAGGFSPFCALGPPEDGNHWFLGPLAEAREKPVWAALAAAWAPRSVSLELWDRNFCPGQQLDADVYCFNDTGSDADLVVQASVLSDEGGRVTGLMQEFRVKLGPYTTQRMPVSLTLPAEVGEWRLRVEMVEGSVSQRPIRSEWGIRTWRPVWAERHLTGVVGVPQMDTELRAFLIDHDIHVVDVSDPVAGAIVTGRATAEQLETDGVLPDDVLAGLRAGKSWLALDLGPVPLGQGYGEDLGPLQAAPVVATPVTHARWLDDIKVLFHEAPEPESHLHGVGDQRDGVDRPKALHWMWNGLRGGLVVPACTFEIGSLGRESLTTLWTGRGADLKEMRTGSYYAYELSGNFAFSHQVEDESVRAALRQRVRFLVEDAPSLAVSIDPEAPIEVTDLAAAYRTAASTGVQAQALAHGGKNLLRTPVWQLTREGRAGRWILSQALTAGRLRRTKSEPGLYGRREDPAAGQFVLDLLAKVLSESSSDPA